LKRTLGIRTQCRIRRQIPVKPVRVGNVIAHESISSISSSHSLRISFSA
jgi:dihydrodipicolinate reductase